MIRVLATAVLALGLSACSYADNTSTQKPLDFSGWKARAPTGAPLVGGFAKRAPTGAPLVGGFKARKPRGMALPAGWGKRVADGRSPLTRQR